MTDWEVWGDCGQSCNGLDSVNIIIIIVTGVCGYSAAITAAKYCFHCIVLILMSIHAVNVKLPIITKLQHCVVGLWRPNVFWPWLWKSVTCWMLWRMSLASCLLLWLLLVDFYHTWDVLVNYFFIFLSITLVWHLSSLHISNNRYMCVFFE